MRRTEMVMGTLRWMMCAMKHQFSVDDQLSVVKKATYDGRTDRSLTVPVPCPNIFPKNALVFALTDDFGA